MLSGEAVEVAEHDQPRIAQRGLGHGHPVAAQRVHPGSTPGGPATVATLLEQIPHGHARPADVAGSHIGQAVAIAARPPASATGTPRLCRSSGLLPCMLTSTAPSA